MLGFSRSLLVAAGLAAGFFPAGAEARSWVVKLPVAGGPVLAGSHVTWLGREAGGALDLYGATRSTRRIQRFAAPTQEPGTLRRQSAVLAESASGVAMELLTTTQPVGRSAAGEGAALDYFVGPFGNRLNKLGETCTVPPSSVAGDLAITDRLLARRACDDRLQIDEAGGESTVIGTSVHAVRASGRFVAFIDGPYDYAEQNAADVVVYDSTTRSIEYTLPASAFPGRLNTLSVDVDGDVAFSYDPRPQDTRIEAVVGWASRDAPSLHRMPLPPRAYYHVLIANGRVVYSRDPAARGFSDRAEIGVAKLGGAGRTLVRRAHIGGFDSDGQRLVFSWRKCRRREVTIRSIRALRTRPARPACNPR